MQLLAEQEEILTTLVEAARTVPRAKQRFYLYSRMTGDGSPSDVVMGDPLGRKGITVLAEDVWALIGAGLLQQTPTPGSAVAFSVTGAGIACYEELRDRDPDPHAAIEAETQRYLDATFAHRYPAAYERLATAEQMLWQSNPSDDFTTIGHKLREAVQQFATTLIEIHKPTDYDADPAKTKNRLRAVAGVWSGQLGSAKTGLLQELADYQDAVNGVLQRQEHGDQKPGDPLTWEDARAAVFHTALMMCEFDRLLPEGA